MRLPNYSKMNLSGYEIVSDTVAGHEQEFLVATPEPSSFLLLGAGLLLAGCGAFRRGRRSIGAARA